jgi:hypothetical protein
LLQALDLLRDFNASGKRTLPEHVPTGFVKPRWHLCWNLTFHGKRGELRQRYREGQEDQLGALGLVNAVILWNTIYMDAALAELRAEGFDVRDEDVARLSPLGHGLCLYASRGRRTRRTASVAPSWRVV